VTISHLSIRPRRRRITKKKLIRAASTATIIVAVEISRTKIRRQISKGLFVIVSLALLPCVRDRIGRLQLQD
jgi:hypothetical protein